MTKKSTSDLKNRFITKMIMIQIDKGKTVEDAINTILGPGAYQKIANDVYDLLQKEDK